VKLTLGVSNVKGLNLVSNESARTYTPLARILDSSLAFPSEHIPQLAASPLYHPLVSFPQQHLSWVLGELSPHQHQHPSQTFAHATFSSPLELTVTKWRLVSRMWLVTAALRGLVVVQSWM